MSHLAGHRDLSLALVRMAEPIERVFTSPTLGERVRTDSALILDALALAPTSAWIEQACATMRECPAQSDESRFIHRRIIVEHAVDVRLRPRYPATAREVQHR